MPDQPDIPVEEVLESHPHRFGQIVAVAIVVTTLLGALCGYLQARSLSRNDDALSRGQQWGALSIQVAGETEQAEQLMLARYRQSEGDRLQGGYLAGTVRFGGASSSSALAAARWQQVAAHVQSDSTALQRGIRGEFATIHAVDDEALLDADALKVGDGPSCRLPAWAQAGSAHGRVPPPVSNDALGEGPDQDPNFPSVYIADNQRQIYQLDGLRDAANTEAAQAEKQFTRYAVSLATLAVAVFMLGYSLTPHGRHHRKLYVAVAGVLVVGASLWGVYAVVRSPHEAAPEAMAAYADGRVANDRGDYALAVRYLTCSIDQDSNFAPAYTWRAQATAGEVQTLYQLTRDQLTRSIADDERAVDRGSSDPNALNELSAGLFVLGLRHDDPGLVQRAEQYIAQARSRDPSNPTIALNFAEDQLMLGRSAARAYPPAILALAHSHPNLGLDSLSSLQSDLQTPLGRRRQSAILAAKQRVVGALSAGTQVAGTDVSSPALAPAGQPSLRVSAQGGIAPGQLEFFLDGGRGFAPARDRLYAVWYQRTGPGWQTIYGASGPVTLRVNGDGVPFSLVTVASQCLGAGQYRVELYVDGRLAGQATTESQSAALQYVALHDMNFSLCHPRGWVRTTGWQPGLVEGFQSRSHRSGMLVVDATAAAASPRVLDDILARLGASVPAGLTPARRDLANVFAGGLCHSYVQEDTYPGGRLAAGIGRDAFNRQLLGIVYGPESMFTSAGSAPSAGSDLFTSMISSVPPSGSTC